MPKQILVLKLKNFLTFICLPASLIDFYYVVEPNKSFGGIAGTDESPKLCFGVDHSDENDDEDEEELS